MQRQVIHTTFVNNNGVYYFIMVNGGIIQDYDTSRSRVRCQNWSLFIALVNVREAKMILNSPDALASSLQTYLDLHHL